MDEGLLASEPTQRRGQPCRVVLPHQLLTFCQNYIPLSVLAHAMRKKPVSLSRLLPDTELVGAKILPNGAQRGALLRISDLGRLAVIGAKARRD